MNLRNLFYRQYFKGIDLRKFPDKTEREIISKWNDDERENHNCFSSKNSNLIGFKPNGEAIAVLHPLAHDSDQKLPGQQPPLDRWTSGQGLVAGTGYAHETGNKGEFKLGFHFDFTSGLPVLPGHSVKGALRAAFPQLGFSRENPFLPKSNPDRLKKSKINWLASALAGANVPEEETARTVFVHRLELAIFEGIIEVRDENDAQTTRLLPICRRDAFLDAAPAPAVAGKLLLGRDALAPHRREGMLKNPIPLPFIKVLPDVPWRFHFLLFNFTMREITVLASHKIDLFKKILCTHGAGAKTRVCYGIFSETPLPKTSANSGQATTTPRDGGGKRLAMTDRSQIRPGKVIEARVIGPTKKEGKCRFLLGIAPDGKEYVQKWFQTLEVASIIQVKVKSNVGDIVTEVEHIE